jgi:hypothetical protein
LPAILVDGRSELQVVGQQDDLSVILSIPNHNLSESMRAVSLSVEPIELNELVPKHVAFHRNHVFLDHLVIRILLHAGDEIDAVFGPRTKESVVIVAPVLLQSSPCWIILHSLDQRFIYDQRLFTLALQKAGFPPP